MFFTSPVSPFIVVADRRIQWRFYLCWWVRQTLWWTWCRTDPVSWWPGSHFLCLPKFPSVPPLPSPSPCTPSRCALLKNNGRRIVMMSHFPPFHTNLSPTFCCSGGAETLYCLEFVYVCSLEYEQAIIENAMMDGHIEHCELPLVLVEALK